MRLSAIRISACLALVILAACGSNTLGKKARGNWQGTASQVNHDGEVEEYPMTIIVTDDEHIVTDYPSLSCSSRLIRLPSSDGFAEFREEITDNKDGCLDGGMVTLSLAEDDNTKLNWGWKYRNPDQVVTYATATLNRVPPSEPKDIEFFRNQQ